MFLYISQGHGSASDDEIKSCLGQTSNYVGRAKDLLLFIFINETVTI